MNILIAITVIAYMAATVVRVVQKISGKGGDLPRILTLALGILTHAGGIGALFFGWEAIGGYPTRGSLLLAAAVLALVCAALEASSGETFFTIFVLPVAMILVVFSGLTTQFLEGQQFQGTWFFLHLGASLMGECFFMMAALSAATYLFMVRKLKSKNRLRAIQFFPPLARLDTFTMLFLRSGVIAFALGLALGAYGWIGAFGLEGMLGARRVFSAVLLLFFTFLLVARHQGWVVGHRLSLLTIVGFVMSLSLVFIARATHWMP